MMAEDALPATLVAQAIAIVHANRAGSIPLLQRRLAIDAKTAEAILGTIATETGAIQRLPGGVYSYTPPAIAKELDALRAFARQALSASRDQHLDNAALTALATAHGIAPQVDEA
ncbi:hypothetical protein RA280_16010 [Cupriavidus sp. CV2]|uniref:hypothetical protein n=1 Tax=Cupriavidus ulmosensis TaxID=3065913 RepID=UPI00296B468B|nr:hypothetical protein [Cupriavidus sp. CV2]MDW3683229.1 hypothetical protein [Cupriavidus sp. CV2]